MLGQANEDPVDQLLGGSRRILQRLTLAFLLLKHVFMLCAVITSHNDVIMITITSHLLPSIFSQHLDSVSVVVFEVILEYKLYSLLKGNQYFEGTHCLHYQGIRIS
jgi:hypothetical protein